MAGSRVRQAVDLVPSMTATARRLLHEANASASKTVCAVQICSAVALFVGALVVAVLVAIPDWKSISLLSLILLLLRFGGQL